jgi:transaldolase
MPEATLHATADHGVLTSNAIDGTYSESRKVFEDLEALGISYADVVRVLEEEGVQKFADSWHEMLTTISAQLDPMGQPAAAGR